LAGNSTGPGKTTPPGAGRRLELRREPTLDLLGNPAERLCVMHSQVGKDLAVDFDSGVA
jgi:hypothetical protein